MAEIGIDCTRGNYHIVPQLKYKNVSLLCPHCGAGWHSETYGKLWHTNELSNHNLPVTFWPYVCDTSKLMPTLAQMRQLNKEYEPGNFINIFLEDDNNDNGFNLLSKRLEKLTNGFYKALPTSGGLIVDYSGLVVCPECYNSLLEILPY